MNHQMQHFNIWERIQSLKCSLDRLELLELLEADLPDQMLCHACYQFHRRALIPWNYRDAPPHYRSVSIEGFDCQKWKSFFDHFGPRLSGDSPSQVFHWMTCNLVMRAKRYSPKHGLPMSRLQHLPDSHRYERQSHGRWHSDHTPFIVGDRLIFLGLRVVHQEVFKLVSQSVTTSAQPPLAKILLLPWTVSIVARQGDIATLAQYWVASTVQRHSSSKYARLGVISARLRQGQEATYISSRSLDTLTLEPVEVQGPENGKPCYPSYLTATMSTSFLIPTWWVSTSSAMPSGNRENLVIFLIHGFYH
jgi:hypothetical protein